MIKIAIVEDDSTYITTLIDYLHRYESETQNKFQIKVYRDGDGIVTDYHSQFDIILMDIQMRFMDGMSAAEEIRKIDDKVMILFITNMAQYAIRSYEVGAMDYILKPVAYFAFTQKLGKAIENLRGKQRQYVVVQIKGGVKRIEVSDIYYVESSGHNLIYHTVKEVFSAVGTMKETENMLTEYHFSRANKGYLINLEYVEGIQDKCAVVNSEKLLISRPRMSEFMKDLTKYWGDM